eukprot:1315845-Pleurochrysis_carterae.AAC.1
MLAPRQARQLVGHGGERSLARHIVLLRCHAVRLVNLDLLCHSRHALARAAAARLALAAHLLLEPRLLLRRERARHTLAHDALHPTQLRHRRRRSPTLQHAATLHRTHTHKQRHVAASLDKSRGAVADAHSQPEPLRS